MAEYETYLVGLLAPLGVYDLTAGTLNESELYALGAGLDQVSTQVEAAEREAMLTTAEDVGLSMREGLFARKPAAPTLELRRAAIAALMQISGDGLTLEAINRTLSGCGVRAEARETERPGYIRIVFPDVSGEPENFEQIQKIIQDIIPCHLEIEYYFRYLTWAECEAQGFTWALVEAAQYTWAGFEVAVPTEE